ncbi:MAG: DUF1361 domain-containing protein [Microscillaceae bacterium]|nr:DUF1361 domain-containing protein [Microscillaceae bacterium]
MYQLWQLLQRKNRLAILLVLALSSVFSLAVLGVRMVYTGEITFRFLVWNLFLAWIPYFISLTIYLWDERLKSGLILGLLLSTWLLFFPNSPYIVTDLLHFRPRYVVPTWYDLILIYSFAWNGIWLGFLSLVDLHNWVKKRFNEWIGWLFVLISLSLGSFGIYLGRYERFNSWDVVTNPLALTREVLEKLLHPFSSAAVGAASITLLFSAFLLITYLTLRVAIASMQSEK